MIGRREFITVLGSAAVAWPFAAQAQQQAMPIIGFLSGVSPNASVERVRAFRQGLKDTGYIEGENVTIEYRWAEGRYDRPRRHLRSGLYSLCSPASSLL